MASSDYIPALINEPPSARAQAAASSHRLSGKELLQTTPVSALLPAHDAFQVTAEQSALDALQVLTEKHVLALPVYDSRTRKYTSFIDMLDIASHVTSKDPATLKAGLATTTCGDLADVSPRNPFRAIEDRTSLEAALQLILTGKLHRLAVLDAEGRFDNVFTQSALIRFINEHIGAFPFASKRVGELELGYQEVVTVTESATAREAFEAIKTHHVSAVGVVNHDGVMVEVLSTSDMRILLQQRTDDDPLPIGLLDLPVVQYLEKRVYASESLRVARGLICVNPATTIEELLFKIVATRVHRAYVVRELKPIGVIALYDILKLVVEDK